MGRSMRGAFIPEQDPIRAMGPYETIASDQATDFSHSGAHKGNPARNVGGTAKDGGLSTGATVADGGPNDSKADPTYKPS